MNIIPPATSEGRSRLISAKFKAFLDAESLHSISSEVDRKASDPTVRSLVLSHRISDSFLRLIASIACVVKL